MLKFPAVFCISDTWNKKRCLTCSGIFVEIIIIKAQGCGKIFGAKEPIYNRLKRPWMRKKYLSLN